MPAARRRLPERQAGLDRDRVRAPGRSGAPPPRRCHSWRWASRRTSTTCRSGRRKSSVPPRGHVGEAHDVVGAELEARGRGRRARRRSTARRRARRRAACARARTRPRRGARAAPPRGRPGRVAATRPVRRAEPGREPSDSRRGLGEALLGELARAHGGHDPRVDRGQRVLVQLGADAERVRAGRERLHRALLDADARREALHLERVGDHDAVEAELLAQQAEHDRAHRRRPVVERRHADVGAS